MYFNFFAKNIYAVKNSSSELIFSELEYKIKPNFSKYKIGPPLVIFFKNAKLITTTKSSANWLCPEQNGQGYNLSEPSNFLRPI